MTKNDGLTREDRRFFSLVAQAIFTNPFGYERDDILEKTELGPVLERPAREMGLMERISPTLNERIHRLESKGWGKIQNFQGEDRWLMEYAFKFQVYIRFASKMNQLIQKQLSGDTASREVPFAEEMIDQLMKRGFSDQESTRYLSLSYQFRRAQYFISQALVGGSSSMRRLRFSLWNNVFTRDSAIYNEHLWNRMEDFSTLLLGETGTGKGAAAAAIGRSAFIPFDRKRGRFTQSFRETFIAINLSQFPESLIESELFGHRKGAFTGAVDHHEGLFEQCSTHGALFMDEIGDISVPTQIKLLQVLQQRTFTPVGSHEQKRFAGRIIAATNRSIPELRKQGNFRNDFFYRLSSDIISVPPLRQRLQEFPSELEQLVNLLVTRLNGQESPKLNDRVLTALARDLPRDYPWPGNVRELEQAVRRVLLTHHYGGDQMMMSPNMEEELVQQFQAGTLKAAELVSGYCVFLYRRFRNYGEVARRTGLDWRTIKKYVQNAGPSSGE